MGRTTCIMALWAMALPAWAGRPLSTEDASMLDQGHCQLEMWADRSSVATDLWTVPACNFGLNVEWQLGGARTFESGTAALTQSYFQAKSIFQSVDDNPWGYGIVLGVNRQPRRETHTGWTDPYAIVPVSFKVAGENLVHLNVGWGHNRAEDRNLTLWGVAFEVPVTESLTFLGESFGENASKPFFRLGGRMNAVKDRLDFDLTFVTRASATKADRFVSLGLYYKTP